MTTLFGHCERSEAISTTYGAAESLQAERRHFAHRVRQQRDANAKFLQLRRRLVNPASQAALAQIERDSKPTMPPPTIAISIALSSQIRYYFALGRRPDKRDERQAVPPQWPGAQRPRQAS